MKNDHFSSLNHRHELFEKLKNNNPIWWQFVKENINPEGFYVDIRKDNSLNVYYNGGSLLKVMLSHGEIKGKIHEHYLGKTGSKYVDFKLNSLPENAKKIMKRIKSKYDNKSESGIKARLICSPKARYIDSEFAYQTTRIDLTKLENSKIVFVELKRIEDGRLLTNEYENGKPEILSQMEEYQKFTKDYNQKITKYYKTLFEIKRDLQILPQSLVGINNIDDYELSENIELYIEPYPNLNSEQIPSLSPRQIRRIEAIKMILNQNNIVHNL